MCQGVLVGKNTPLCDDLFLDFGKDLFSVIDKNTFPNITNDLQNKMLKNVSMIKINPTK